MGIPAESSLKSDICKELGESNGRIPFSWSFFIVDKGLCGNGKILGPIFVFEFTEAIGYDSRSRNCRVDIYFDKSA